MLRKQPVIDYNKIYHAVYQFYNFDDTNNRLSHNDDLFPIPLLYDDVDYKYLWFISSIMTLNIDELNYIITNDVYPFKKGNCIDFSYIRYFLFLQNLEKELRASEENIEKAISHNQTYEYFSKYGEEAYSVAMQCKEKLLGDDIENLTESGINLLKTIKRIDFEYCEQIAIERRNILRKNNTFPY